MKKLYFIAMLSAVIASQSLRAQKNKEDKTQFSVVLGLNQPIVTHGFNVEVNYWMKKIVFDYSHGFGLQFTGNLVSEDAKSQQLNFNIKHSLGVGFGYRITKSLNLRLEPKLHIWEMYYRDKFKSEEGKITSYKTYTLGLGAYYRWLPFAKSESFIRGITISPSVRWWPNIATSLENNKLNYFNQRTGRNEVHKANNIGVSNSPFFANVSIGYTF